MQLGELASIPVAAWPAGSEARGRALLGGHLLLGGREHPINEGDLWLLADQDSSLSTHLHGFEWLDDLLAAGGVQAIRLAQNWLFDWIDRYSNEQVFPLTQQVAGRRIVRLLRNRHFVLAMQDEGRRSAFTKSVKSHIRYLRRRRLVPVRGFARVEMLAGCLMAELVVGEERAEISKMLDSLVGECSAMTGADKGIASRNPEELIQLLSCLVQVAAMLDAAGINPRPELAKHIEHSADILSSLRHVNGDLPRFHGGGNGAGGFADRLISEHRGHANMHSCPAMGYCRMRAGNTSAVLDIAPPPFGPASVGAHASTLAFELVSARHPIIVSRGPGRGFGPDTLSAARSTDAHSTVVVNDASSSVFAARNHSSGEGPSLASVPTVRVDQLPGNEGLTMIASHSGYFQAYGLTHLRRVDMRNDGKRIWAEDTVWEGAGSRKESKTGTGGNPNPRGHRLAVRFHLHPDVSVYKYPGSSLADVELPDGETWRFRFEGPARLELEESQYLDEGSQQIRPASQIVLHSDTREGVAQLRWEIGRVQERQE